MTAENIDAFNQFFKTHKRLDAITNLELCALLHLGLSAIPTIPGRTGCNFENAIAEAVKRLAKAKKP